ncbi:MAG: polysaccharide lyase beta-sandwich domain-containing protein [Bacteroidota bacterium]|nr:polysaccharide lyase beta-sandwich domain-containing protein [Bacteroidota bacterium]
MKNDGSWSDINYQDDKRSGWDPRNHVERILALTTLYSNPQSKYFKDKKIKVVLHKALNFWFDANLVCPNWWYNEIGIPKTLGPAFIFLESELSADELAGAIKVLNHSSFKQTGQNKVWQAGNVLLKAILIKDKNLAQRARDTIFSELRITEDEGIQADYSFHQHGPQQQFGNYGLAFVSSLSFWSRIFSGTALHVDNDRLSILRKLMINGFNWVSWKGYFDVNSLGRQFFKDIQKTKSLSLAYSMIDMTYVDPKFKDDYMAFIYRNYTDKKANRLTGTKHFWRSDMTVHMSPLWYSSVKMSSDRVKAAEALNSENLKGYYMGDGTAFVYVDGDEYADISPYWNWKKLPGVTNWQTDAPLPVLTFEGYHNKGDFTGGISDGTNGITSFQLNRDSLYANKSWFYLGDEMICLGSNIHGDKNEPVTTTINQARLKGSVYFFDDNKINELKEGSTVSSKTMQWVYHDKIGYYYLNPAQTTASAKVQSGNWADIAAVYKGTDDISKPVFTLEIDHDIRKGNSYAYIILPAVSLNDLKSFKPGFDLIKNDDDAQVISKKDGSITLLAIYKPSEIKVPGMPLLNFKNAGLYMLEKKGNGWVIYASDPTQKLSEISFEFGQKNQTIKLPQGADKGSTTYATINEK